MQTSPRKQDEYHEFTINIHLSRRLSAVLIVAMLAISAVAFITWDSNPAQASSPEAPVAVSGSSGMRKFYLKSQFYDGNEPDSPGVCGTGYHFASIWELMDISNLEYAGELANADYRSDSGEGPPTSSYGWVRTGYSSNGSSTPGQANCLNWSDDTSGSSGSIAKLPHDWTDESLQDLSVWNIDVTFCNGDFYVWCIED